MPSRKAEGPGGPVRFGAASAGFRRRTVLPKEDGPDPLLLEAIQRAREGDRDALTCASDATTLGPRETDPRGSRRADAGPAC